MIVALKVGKGSGQLSTAPAGGERVDEEVPAEIPRGRGGRPKVRALVPETVPGPDGKPVETGRLVESTSRYTEMTRASTLGKALDSAYALQQWGERVIVFGMSRAPYLVQAAQAVLSYGERPDILDDAQRKLAERRDREALQEIAERAKQIAAGDKAAMRGTALHKLSEHLDAGHDLSYLDAQTAAALHTYRRLIGQLAIIGTEQFVVADHLGAAGTYDRLVELTGDTPVTGFGEHGERVVVDRLPAGTRVILDLKTNRSASRFGAVYAVQQYVYASGTPYTAAAGRGEWPDGIRPSQRWALILHVPAEDLDAAGFYWVDLEVGRRLAALAVDVREAQRTAKLAFARADLASAVLDDGDGSSGGDDVLARIRAAATAEDLQALYRVHEDVWTDAHTAAAAARVEALRAQAAAVVEVDDAGESYTLVELVQRATTHEQLRALYAAHEDAWDDECTIAAREVAARIGGAA